MSLRPATSFLALFLLLLFGAGLSGQAPTLVVPTGHGKAITDLAASPAGDLLASAALDATVKVWNTAASREVHTFRPKDYARSLAFSPDGKYLAAATFTELYVWEVGSWRPVKTIKGWFMDALVFHPTRNELFYQTQKINSTGEDPQQVWRITLPAGSPSQLATVPFAESGRHKMDHLDISPTGQQLLLVTGDGIGHLIPTNGAARTQVEGARRFTPTGNLLCISDAGTSPSLSLRRTDGSSIWQSNSTKEQTANRNLTHVAGFGGPAGHLYWINQDGKLVSGDYRTNTLTVRNLPGILDSELTIATNGILYVAGKSPFQIHGYALPDLQTVVTLGESILLPAQLAAQDGSQLLAWGSAGSLKTLEMKGRKTITTAITPSLHAGRLHLSANGSLLATGATSGDNFSYHHRSKPLETKRFKSELGPTAGVASSGDGNFIGVAGRNGFMVLNTASHKFVVREALPATTGFYQDDVALSPTGNLLLLNQARIQPDGSNRTWHLLYDVSQKSKRWEATGRLEDPSFSADGSTIYGLIYEFVVQLDASTGRELRRWPLPKGRFPYAAQFNRAKTMVAYSHSSRGYVLDLRTGQESELKTDATLPIERVAFVGEDFMISAGNDELVSLWDLRSRRRVAQLVQYAAAEGWAVVAPDGRFDAAPWAMQRMYYRVGTENYPLEQLLEGFYTPGLLAEILSRSSTPPPPVNINRIGQKPTVTIQYTAGTRNLTVEDDDVAASIVALTQDAKIVVKAVAAGSTVAEIRLYHNGKLVSPGTRNLIVEDDPGGNEKSFQLRLLPGENTLKAVAINAERTESDPALLLIQYTAPADAPANNSLRDGITLHLLTVGINQYKNPRYNLNYAEADAAGLENRLQTGMQGLVGNTRLYSIRNEQATRANILAALETVRTQAGPNDVFVFYFAGHGVMSEGTEADFFLVPHDVTQLYGDPNSLQNKGISATEMKNLAAAIPAQKQLYLLDACQSAGAVQRMAARGAAEEKAIAQLARSTGTHWLTASGSEQFASEFDQLGHGAFTYVLLAGLAGEAAGNDQRVSVNELKAYLEATVPELTEKHSGQAQYPASFGFGQDFPVGVVKK
ncbi:caspase family protein [Neolewinella lacunae]|uniref:Caspase family protein n=1 Tax=Neolewinella lacunae TaxID=1517758 RepID=A0A923PMM6_9BACT|nr:caspase family protein [Neolewinella lacunae]MBC6995225.1 caspase family protein [Neolewinella lacunae]MDN3635466.1 caspase family protein [Neolewinella lacunae]